MTYPKDGKRLALDLVNDPPVANAQFPITFQGVPKRRPELVWEKGQFLFDGSPDPLPFGRSYPG
jgi:hypothetical protein